MKTLILTSPYTENDDVTTVQKALKVKGWMQGGIDGVYGPATARSVKYAKHRLGYPTPDNIAGDVFMQYLTGTKQRGPVMLALAKKRSLVSPVIARRRAMVVEARKWIGTKEDPPRTNIVFFTKWYGATGPWCAMFITYCGTKVGLKSFDKNKQRWAYVPYMVHDAKAGQNGLVEIFQPEQGDLGAMDWDNDGVSDHVVIFDKWLNRGVTFQTIEGNTGHFDASNGGEVLVMIRNTNDVQSWIRVVA